MIKRIGRSGKSAAAAEEAAAKRMAILKSRPPFMMSPCVLSQCCCELNRSEGIHLHLRFLATLARTYCIYLLHLVCQYFGDEEFWRQ
jgi:hypothetical protein